MKKYHIGANAYFALNKSIQYISITHQDYFCPRATDIFEASAQVLIVSKYTRKRGRVVEGNSLENCHTRNGIEGSNPSASAKKLNKKIYAL